MGNYWTFLKSISLVLIFGQTSCTGNSTFEVSDKMTIENAKSNQLIRKISLDVQSLTITEGSAAIINVAVNTLSKTPIIVNLSLSDSIGRFQTTPISITIPANTLSKPIALQTIDDNIYQGSSSATLTISSGTSGVTSENSQLSLSVNDNDALPEITVSDASSNEGDDLSFVVSLNRESSKTTTFKYSTVNGSALSGGDFSSQTDVLFTIPPGSTTGVFTLTPLNDSISEGNENFNLNLAQPSNATLLRTSVLATIIDDDAVPAVSFSTSGQSASEANEMVTLNLILEATSAQNITVPFSLTGAATGADYTSLTASPLTISAGQTSAQIQFTTLDDNLDEVDEDLIFNIGAPTNASVGLNSNHTITIIDNDSPPSVEFTSNTSTVNENVGPTTLTLELSTISGKDITIPLSLSGTAIANGDDYSITESFPISIPAGVSSASIEVNVLNDSNVEVNETAIFTIETPSQATIGTTNIHTLTINDDDVEISITDNTANENAGSLTFTVSLSKSSIHDVTVDWSTSSGTAISGINFQSSMGSLTIPSGSTSGTINVSLIDTPSVCEGNRTFTISLSNSIHGIIIDNSAIGTISEDDVPELNISGGTFAESGVGFAIATLSSTCSQNVTVNYSTSDSTAIAGSDFLQVVNRSITFPAGTSSQYIPVSLLNDFIVEPSESVDIILGSPTNATIGLNTATITITDDDSSLSSASNILQVSNSGNHTCVVTTTNELKCWGRNTNSELGTATPYLNQWVPQTLTSLGANVTKVSAGGLSVASGFTCAIVSNAAKCWGHNYYGQLGDNSTTTRTTPIQVSGLTSNVTDISVGAHHSCAVVNGGAKCWGRNHLGQLGNGTTTQSNVPVDVSGLTSGVSGISVSQYSSCAVLTDGTIRCWGDNTGGQLGNGTTTNSSTPVSVTGIDSGATFVSVAYRHACAIVSSALKCWGQNNNGQLGNGTTTNSSTPVDVTSMSDSVTAVKTSGDDMWGTQSTCAVKAGALKCWGSNFLSQIANVTSGSTTPQNVTGLATNVTAISLEPSNACAIQNGTLYCWGTDYNNVFARVGSATNFVPFDTLFTSGVQNYSAGGYGTSCAAIDGAAKCWGGGGTGSLGNGTGGGSTSPVIVTGLNTGVAKVLVSGHGGGGDGNIHACALLTSGALRCWGSNNYGQIGDGTTSTRNSPVEIFSSGVADFDVSYGNHTCAIMTSGALKCWGRNDKGQLGDNSTTQRTTPVDVNGLSSGVTAVSGSRYHTCAIVNGGLKCWGDETKGQLGRGTVGTYVTTPQDVLNMSNGVTSISVTGVLTTMRSCAVKNAAAYCWGYGYNCGNGNASCADTSTPTLVQTLSTDVHKVSTNEADSCALKTDGSVKCWGLNSYGQSGAGNLTISSVPQSVIGLQAGVLDIDLGYYSACAMTVGNMVKCWGSNHAGQLGLGWSNISSSPIEIKFP